LHVLKLITDAPVLCSALELCACMEWITCPNSVPYAALPDKARKALPELLHLESNATFNELALNRDYFSQLMDLAPARYEPPATCLSEPPTWCLLPLPEVPALATPGPPRVSTRAPGTFRFSPARRACSVPRRTRTTRVTRPTTVLMHLRVRLSGWGGLGPLGGNRGWSARGHLRILS
jgi:hypothetical protein